MFGNAHVDVYFLIEKLGTALDGGYQIKSTWIKKIIVKLNCYSWERFGLTINVLRGTYIWGLKMGSEPIKNVSDVKKIKEVFHN